MARKPKTDSEPRSLVRKTDADKKSASAPVEPTASLSAFEMDADPISKAEEAQLNQVIKKALFRHRADVVIDQKDKVKEMQHLASIVSEYLDPFVVIGYTLEGEKTSIFHASTSRDEAALVDLIRSTFIEIVNNRP